MINIKMYLLLSSVLNDDILITKIDEAPPSPGGPPRPPGPVVRPPSCATLSPDPPRRLTKNQKSLKTTGALKKAANFPLRKYAVKA